MSDLAERLRNYAQDPEVEELPLFFEQVADQIEELEKECRAWSKTADNYLDESILMKSKIKKLEEKAEELEVYKASYHFLIWRGKENAS